MRLPVRGLLLSRRGLISHLCVCVDLTKWLPHWCANSGPGEDEGAGVKLTMAQWGCAFDRYALGAAACGQLSYTAALAHKDICLQVGERAGAKMRRPWLAIVYDRIARRIWCERAFENEQGFSVDRACVELSEALLLQAEAEFDRTAFNKRAQGSGDWNQKPAWKNAGGWAKSSWGKRQGDWQANGPAKKAKYSH